MFRALCRPVCCSLGKKTLALTHRATPVLLMPARFCTCWVSCPSAPRNNAFRLSIGQDQQQSGTQGGNLAHRPKPFFFTLTTALPLASTSKQQRQQQPSLPIGFRDSLPNNENITDNSYVDPRHLFTRKMHLKRPLLDLGLLGYERFAVLHQGRFYLVAEQKGRG